MEPHDWHFTNQQDLAIRIKPIEETYVAHTLGFLFQAIRAIAGGKLKDQRLQRWLWPFARPRQNSPNSLVRRQFFLS